MTKRKKAPKYEIYPQQQQIKPIKSIMPKFVAPLTQKQTETFSCFDKYHLVLNGTAGTGKTYCALYLALKAISSKDSHYKKIIIVRPLVQSYDIGFLPGGISGDDNGKLEPFMVAYKSIVDDLCGKGTWDAIYGAKIEFHCTSFLRGLTLSDSIVIADEVQNCDFHILDSIITRVGTNTKLVLCGDYYQSDLKKQKDKNGILKFLKILENVKHFHEIKFTRDDIVRSKLVRDYIIAKEDFENR